MFSKEESRLLRQEFWTSFGKSFPRKWLLYNTKIKGLSFKFHFDSKKAFIALDLEDDLENRINCWEKLIALKSILHSDYLPNAIYEEEFYLENGKELGAEGVEEIIKNLNEINPSSIVEGIATKLNWGADKLRDDITCLALNLENTELLKTKK